MTRMYWSTKLSAKRNKNNLSSSTNSLGSDGGCGRLGEKIKEILSKSAIKGDVSRYSYFSSAVML